MTKAQRWTFILFTLPFCCIALAIGISMSGRTPERMDLNLRLGNVRSNHDTYKSYAKQEILDIHNLD